MKIDPLEMEKKARHILIGNILVPRPIAFVSTISQEGILNLAPYAMFGLCSYTPTMVYISIDRKPDGSKKDTAVNIEQTGEYVVNMVVEEISEQMNITSDNFPYGTDEFRVTGLTPVASDLVKPPRVKESPVNLECRVTQIMEFGKPTVNCQMMLAEVLRVHIADHLIKDKDIDGEKYNVVGRMGLERFSRPEIFRMKLPRNFDCV